MINECYNKDVTECVNLASDSIKVSIIMYVSSNDICLDESIASIVNQTHQNWELIIVDDYVNKVGNELLDEILQKYSNDPRVVILHNKEHYGKDISIDFAEAMCSGDFITVYTSYDICLKTRLRAMVLFSVENDLQIVGTYKINNDCKSMLVIDLLSVMYHNSIFDKCKLEQL
jgi:glycosyltransferase involved in cell wall biosynthesis